MKTCLGAWIINKLPLKTLQKEIHPTTWFACKLTIFLNKSWTFHRGMRATRPYGPSWGFKPPKKLKIMQILWRCGNMKMSRVTAIQPTVNSALHHLQQVANLRRIQMNRHNVRLPFTEFFFFKMSAFRHHLDAFQRRNQSGQHGEIARPSTSPPVDTRVGSRESKMNEMQFTVKRFHSNFRR